MLVLCSAPRQCVASHESKQHRMFLPLLGPPKADQESIKDCWPSANKVYRGEIFQSVQIIMVWDTTVLEAVG